jgi:putative transposase
MPANFKRKNIRLQSENYRGRRLYFATLCFYERRPLGNNQRFASWLIGRLRVHAAANEFLVHAYCIMPDHMHLLAEGANDECNLRDFIERFKQRTAFEFSGKATARLWQFKYYDHIVRTGEAGDQIAWYIWMNPVRKGLCRTPQDYPLSGSFTDVGAKMLKKPFTQVWSPPWRKMPQQQNQGRARNQKQRVPRRGAALHEALRERSLD